ncbi:flavodoxin family protein [Geovibrio thiophilus]|uniref:Flavodoxin family protein n=1 Tax=Geovibrio thiophilus TaxID=139438 RepID=A0A3R6AXF9_9BACT|nr:NAD(P)H-dependent oxidoreductase [Geovibrio thiophilus]QAR32709.1 flavodoxin family protein [Geovibrio thiophilus]
MKTLVIYGHSSPEQSLSNAAIVAELAKLPDVKVRTLAEHRVNGHFNVEAEQQALVEADRIVFQFPFNWYSLPWILKQWVDEVITYGFAYGEGGDKLKDKSVILSFTTGVQAEGYVSPTTDELLLPVKQTLALTQIRLEPSESSNGMMYIPGFAGDKDEVQAKALAHAKRLAARLK